MLGHTTHFNILTVNVVTIARLLYQFTHPKLANHFWKVN